MHVSKHLFNIQVGGIPHKRHEWLSFERQLTISLLSSRPFQLARAKSTQNEQVPRRFNSNKINRDQPPNASVITRGSVTFIDGLLILDKTKECIDLQYPHKNSFTFERPFSLHKEVYVSFKNAIGIPHQCQLAPEQPVCDCGHECSFFNRKACDQPLREPQRSQKLILVIKESTLYAFNASNGRIAKSVTFEGRSSFTYKSSVYNVLDDTLIIHLGYRDTQNFIIFSCHPFIELKTIRINGLSVHMLSPHIIACPGSTKGTSMHDLTPLIEAGCASNREPFNLTSPLLELTGVSPYDISIGGHSRPVLLFTTRTEKKHYKISFPHNVDQFHELDREERTVFDECYFMRTAIANRIVYLSTHSMDVLKIDREDDCVPRVEKMFTIATEERKEIPASTHNSNRPRRSTCYQGSYALIIRSIFAHHYNDQLDLIAIYGVSRETYKPFIQIFDATDGKLINAIQVKAKFSKYSLYRVYIHSSTVTLIESEQSSATLVYIFDIAPEAITSDDEKIIKKKNESTKKSQKKGRKNGQKIKQKEKLVSSRKIKFKSFGKSHSESEDTSDTEIDSKYSDDSTDEDYDEKKDNVVCFEPQSFVFHFN